MATTTGDDIWTPDSGDDYALTTDLARTADDVQDALNVRKRVYSGAGSPTGITSPSRLDEYVNTSDGVRWWYDGTTWIASFATFSPSWSGLTLGNGSAGGQYWRDGSKLDFLAWFSMGSTTAFTGAIKLTLPVTPSIQVPGPHEIIGVGSVNRPGVFFGPVAAVITSATAPQVELLAYSAGGTYAGYSPVNSTTPGAWGSGAIFSVRGTYRV